MKGNCLLAVFFLMACVFNPVLETPAHAGSDFQKIFKGILKQTPQKGKDNSKTKGANSGLGQMFKMFSPSRPDNSKAKPKGFLNEALKQVDLAKEIEKKASQLESDLNKVFLKIRTYQAMNGAVWLGVGKSYKALLTDLKDLEHQGDQKVKTFINHTRLKQNQQMELIAQVTIDTSAGLSESSETIRLNHQKNENLRHAVTSFIRHNPLVGCSFSSVINDQNTSLDKLLDSYIKRLNQITLHQQAASKIFSNMAIEFKGAEKQMRKAIDTFNQESVLVSVKAAEHLEILYRQGANLSNVLEASKGNYFTALTLVPEVTSALIEIKRLQGELKTFNQHRDKLANQSVQIMQICQSSSDEILQSSRDLARINSMCKKMWANQMAQIKKIANQRKVQTKDLVKALNEEETRNRKVLTKISETEEKQMKQMANAAFGEPVFN